MAEQTTKSTERVRPKHELVLYRSCITDFEFKNIYAIGGVRGNARYFAHQFDCDLEFRESQYTPTGIMNFVHSYLEKFGIGSDGSCVTAMLVGDDKEKLKRARKEILRIFGSKHLDDACIEISNRRSPFS